MKKILFGLIGVVMAVAMIGGAFAYFTDAAASTGNTFESGTLTVAVNDNGSADTFAITLSGIDNLAPGDITPWINIKVENTGSIDAATYARFYFPGVSDLGPALKIYDWQALYFYSDDSANNRWNGGNDPYFGTAANEDYIIKDGVAGFNMGANFLAVDPGDNRGAWDGEALPPGGYYTLKVRLQMDPNAGNEYQDKSLVVGFQVKATQNYAAAILALGITNITDLTVAGYDVDYFDLQLPGGAVPDQW